MGKVLESIFEFIVELILIVTLFAAVIVAGIFSLILGIPAWIVYGIICIFKHDESVPLSK